MACASIVDSVDESARGALEKAGASASDVVGVGSVDALRPVCGLPISTYFTGVKLKWMVDNLPEVKKAIEGGTACVGTVDAWLAWKLTDGAAHVTDVTNASRTMMMDLQP